MEVLGLLKKQPGSRCATNVCWRTLERGAHAPNSCLTCVTASEVKGPPSRVQAGKFMGGPLPRLRRLVGSAASAACWFMAHTMPCDTHTRTHKQHKTQTVAHVQ